MFLDDFKAIFGHDYWWVVQVFLVVLLTLFVALFANHSIVRMSRLAKTSKNFWDDAFFRSLLQPVRGMVWLVGISFAAELAVSQADGKDGFIRIIHSFREVASIGVFTWFLVGFVGRVERFLVQPESVKKPMDRTTAAAVGKLIRIAIGITSGLVVLQALGYSISGVLAFGGIGGIAVGFAAKDLLANFFGGLMLYLDRPFKVGDWIRSPDKEIEGTVEEIGWRLTRIRTFDKRPLYVPNSTFMQISVENPSRMTNRRIYETIGIRYEDVGKLGEIVSRVKLMIQQHDDLDMNQTVIVNFNACAPSSMDFFVYCFTKTTDWIEFHEIKQDVLLQIIQIIESLGAETAFPTSTIHVATPLAVSPEFAK